jgi:hypothetical protein
MKKTILLIACAFIAGQSKAQFPTTAQNWNIPTMESSGTNLDQVNGANYSLVDINGDGKADLVDAQDQGTGSVWFSGNPYWKVYINSGSGFNSTAVNWTIPTMESSGANMDQVSGANYSLVDINGDGKPDLVDAQDQGTGSVWFSGSPYWKVYINSGTGFNMTAENWTIPSIESSGTLMDQTSGVNYSLVDINGDGKPDLVDAQDQGTSSVWFSGSPYWKVYINSGSGFNSTAVNWTIPTMESSGANMDQVSAANYSLVDINGDGYPDLVDAQDQGTGSVWFSGSPYWKVYLNNGTSFNLTAQNWNIPTMESSGANLDQVYNANYSLVDINGDSWPDLVDAQDQGTGSVWFSGAPYWKVYINSGNAFASTAQNWTIPQMESSGANLDQVNGANYSLVDITGNGHLDLVDAQDQGTGSVWFSGSAYWKVYSYLVDVKEIALNSLKIYPNPTSGIINLDLTDFANESHVVITNSIGSVVFESTVSNMKHFEYNMDSCESGVYFISLENDDSIYTSRIIKQ